MQSTVNMNGSVDRNIDLYRVWYYNTEMATIKDIRKHIKNEEEAFFDDYNIEEVVRSHVPFSSFNASDWNRVYCQVCGDGARTKGPRGAWRFEGDNCFYNCFNCGISGAFTPSNDIFMSRDMKTIFEAYGISKREYGRILFKHRKDREQGIIKPEIQQKERVEDLLGAGIEVPDYLVELEKASNTNLGKKAIRFLEEEKCINYKDYPFFISYGKTNSKSQEDKINAKIMVNRLIIPIYYHSRLLLLQGRALENNVKNKYINIGNVSQTLYGLDRLNDNHEYIFVTEGFFDAYYLNGVACITNKLTAPKIKILNSFEKEKIVVPDRNESTLTMLNKGVEEDWGCSMPKHLKNCKDVTEAVKKYGKLFTIHEIMKYAKTGDEAKFFVRSLGSL